MSIKEIVLISGKGGTGKTTITASLIPFLKNPVIADCDVDAPDLDILLKPVIQKCEDFIATSKAVINPDSCINCGKCMEVCRFNAITPGNESPVINNFFCEGCDTCTLVCKSNAISLQPYKTGEIYKSKTVYGDMIHGRLTPGEEVSGRLVSQVRKKAGIKAKELNAEIIVIDGPPGISCNVISAITGTNLAIIVTEPTISGLHDLIRVHKTAKKLSVTTGVIINKNGLSEKYTSGIKNYCNGEKITILGSLPLSNQIPESINNLEIPSIYCKKFFYDNGWQKMIHKIYNLIDK